MNKKGFTLIELLAGLVIIGVFLVVLVFVVRNTFSASVVQLDEVSDNQVYAAAKSYATEYNLFKDGESICITVESLIDYGYLDDNISTDLKTRMIKMTRNKSTKVIEEVKYVLMCN